ncbi:MAG: hypothetical protein AB7S41_02380 [Parvibaculaceae bacterium]
MSTLFGLPPPNPFATSILSEVLANITRKPRSRSEWEARFSHWQRPASDTEEQKIEAAKRRIWRALHRSTFLPTRQWAIIPQGSYHNNTNVRNDADVDLCVCLTDAYFTDGPAADPPTMAELGLEPLPFTFEEFKQHIAICVRDEYGALSLEVGKKALHLHKDDNDRVSVDVVPAFVYRLYGSRQNQLLPRGAPVEGIALNAVVQRITNFPRQHYTNGCAKNDRTGRRYKRVVRILKRLRNHMAENVGAAAQIRSRAKATASFLIESLVYNCPDNLFGNASIYDDVLAVLGFLSHGLSDRSDGRTLLTMPIWALWVEVNGVKMLFGNGQTWSVHEALEFVSFAQSYMST